MIERNTSLAVCLLCDWLWSVSILATCTYIVFWMNQSGWWYMLAIILMGCWNCKPYRSPEQIAAWAAAKKIEMEEDENE
jgi:hypothetical protein